MGRRRRPTAKGTANLELFDPSAPDLPKQKLERADSKSESVPAADREEYGPYLDFYAALKDLREEFHRIGRFDDSNAKLDELCKLLVLKVVDQSNPHPSGQPRISLAFLENLAAEKFGDPSRHAAALHDVFDELMSAMPEAVSWFGSRPFLNIEKDDDNFAKAIIPVLESLPGRSIGRASRWNFDAINEVFGHFVQESFRNRKEDGQYMTPPEVVSAMVEIALQDIKQGKIGDDFIVADPTCGVGSFLAAFFRHVVRNEENNGVLDRLQLRGQDKVDRMVRLANVNLNVFASASAVVSPGNSITSDELMSDVAGRVDLILTNPPFGATFDSAPLFDGNARERFPVISRVGSKRGLPNTIDSEFLMFDRCLSLLRPGGHLSIVVPDKIVSGGGFAEAFRHSLLEEAHLRAVINLPSVTFAQAGTRTKTAVVYLQKKGPNKGPAKSGAVFMAVCDDVGYQVVTRAGVGVKRIEGENQLEKIETSFKTFDRDITPQDPFEVLRANPSVASVAKNRITARSWNPSFFSPERYEALRKIGLLAQRGYGVMPLHDIVEIDPDSDTRVLAQGNERCISVLHVGEDGYIDLQGVQSYKPTTPCVRCRPGDVLLSRINPRIVRICVVPKVKFGLGCSSEFAVLRPTRGNIDAYSLALLLRTSLVQYQVQGLASGTSSSHNRVKKIDLAEVVIPVPSAGTDEEKRLVDAARVYRDAVDQYYLVTSNAAANIAEIEELVTE